MRFDNKSDAIKHLSSILGGRCTVEDGLQEVLIYGEDVASFYRVINGLDGKVKMKLIYKVKQDETGYWQTYLNRNGTFVKMAG